MRDLDRAALDRHIAGGRYSETLADFTCPDCGHEYPGVVCSEYGAGWFEPEECPKCGGELDEDDWHDAEPPERFDTLEERGDYYRDV